MLVWDAQLAGFVKADIPSQRFAVGYFAKISSAWLNEALYDPENERVRLKSHLLLELQTIIKRGRIFCDLVREFCLGHKAELIIIFFNMQKRGNLAIEFLSLCDDFDITAPTKPCLMAVFVR